ncbi:MAG: TRAP transporter large permease subunit [Acetobacteraceae bacterium]|nr:TRAP transporter large permease subunit [Acetobacteraceae bacterium]
MKALISIGFALLALQTVSTLLRAAIRLRTAEGDRAGDNARHSDDAVMLIGAQVFALAFRGLQGEALVHDLLAFLPGGVAADIWFLMALVFVLGIFLARIEITYIAVPPFLPVFANAGVDPVVARHPDLRQPADSIPDSALRLGVALPA